MVTGSPRFRPGALNEQLQVDQAETDSTMVRVRVHGARSLPLAWPLEGVLHNDPRHEPLNRDRDRDRDFKLSLLVCVSSVYF